MGERALAEVAPAVAIRPAELGDFAAIAALLAELGRPALTPEDIRAARAVYERHVARADTASLVAIEGGAVVGFLSIEFRERLNRTRPQAWIPDLIVTEAHRGRGAGRALLLAAIAEAERRGCWSVQLESGSSRHIAHALYRSAGLSDDGSYWIRYL